jgi:hypothetical protein
MKRFQLIAASLLCLTSVTTGAPAFADTVQARCDVYPPGDDQATSTGLCTFSQRQGFVSIQLKGGQTITLKPNTSVPDSFVDANGEPARREMIEANRGHIYRLRTQTIFVFWDSAPYMTSPSSGDSSPRSAAPCKTWPTSATLL